MRHFVGFTVIAFMLTVTCSALAQDRSSVRRALSGLEDAPSASEWTAMGEGTLPTLIALFDDGAEEPFIRMRALWAARFFPTSAARSFLERVVSDRSLPGLWLRTAVLSLAAAFGRSAVPAITPLLTHADVAVREATIRSLGGLGGSEARAALEARRGREGDPWLTTLLDQTLAAVVP